jgi:DNA-binding MarR family transcriptional regulator
MSDACANDPIALVLTLSDQLRSHLEHAAREVGLTSAQAKLLVQVDEPRRMGDLAEHQVCDPSSITSIVGRLERDGLVRRDPDPCDGRVRVVVLTAAGRRRRDHFFDALRDLPDPFAELTDDQRRALADRLDAPAAALRP